MPRKKTGEFDQREYEKAYHREHTTYRKLSLNDGNELDQRIAAWIDSQPESTSAYLKRLVLEDMKRRKSTMANVVNKAGKQIDFASAVTLMDDEIREELHAEGIDDEQEFFDRYCERHIAKFGEEFEPNKENPVW